MRQTRETTYLHDLELNVTDKDYLLTPPAVGSLGSVNKDLTDYPSHHGACASNVHQP